MGARIHAAVPSPTRKPEATPSGHSLAWKPSVSEGGKKNECLALKGAASSQRLSALPAGAQAALTTQTLTLWRVRIPQVH